MIAELRLLVQGMHTQGGIMGTTSKSGGWSFDGEKRAHSRVPLRSPAMLDSQSTYQSGLCEDVSAGGLLVTLDQPLVVGTRIELYFELPTGVAIETTAEVVRAEGRRVGLRFIDLDPSLRRALLAYCELSGVRRIRLQPAASS